ncbi:polysaccharide pyruvyl transferase family protein [Agreia sp. Leaf244]|uniref:polysaccharide pyruvyl transferase family protein n=1 Tax=Agreia sp. Leaf244 TaxID=1736305 RepID=UPI000A709AE3
MLADVQSVFVSVIGQEDNLGDSVLRRGLLEALRSGGLQLYVLIGSNSDGYCRAAGLAEGDRVFRSRSEWLSSFSKMRPSEATFVLNAGESQVHRRRLYLGGRQAASLILARLRGAAIIQTGVGLRGADNGRLTVPPLALRMSNLVTWRDQKSRDYARIGRVSPDWAFALGTPTAESSWASPESDRQFLAISMRGDRPAPTATWYAGVRRAAEALQLTPVILTQVRRDSSRSVEIAAKLGGGANAMEWHGEDHAAQETVVREIYRQSGAVLSDRLHALIIGATEGAVPVGYTVGSPEKVDRTLGAVGLRSSCFSAADENDPHRIVGIVQSDSRLSEIVSAARADLAVLSKEMVGIAQRQPGSLASETAPR